MLKPHNDDRFLADHSGKDSSIEVSTIMDAPFLSTPQEKDRNDPITISFHHASMKNEVETSRVESSNSRKNQEWLPSSTIMKGCFQPIVFAAVASCCCFLLILVLIILTFIHPSREDFLSSSTIQRSSPLNRNSLFSTSLSRNPHAIRSRKVRKSSYGDPQPLDQYDDASSSTFLTSLVCPFSIYGSQWYEYWSNRNKSNSNHSKLFSQTEAIVNEYLPLYNQTEWVFKFPNQSSPLSCPAITINERSKSVLINYQYDADVSFYYGNIEAYCPQEDFPYDSICDRMFCFSQDMLNELEQATNDSKIFDYGLNLTSLLVKDIDLIPEGPLYTQQLSLSIMFSWMESYLKGAKISFNPILSESIWNNITQFDSRIRGI
ncbi:hypothetical protein C9374_013221 [Naegleria lovaniensis]|uniref:Uncharacterized protein n=1 Tax=Naegleria lovaniensis TaxID=51637 RepID=A0AA88KDB0_NAELO|nr:uncharacterized protein C9374_013221 [Naegleria lovaniensis]KAG2372769.1 hypothetical protein C9374_013221 [Naegleria lovaniensis]